MSNIPALCRAINNMKAALEGCSDHFCILKVNEGMATNSGCRCMRGMADAGLELAVQADAHKHAITGYLPLSEFKDNQ